MKKIALFSAIALFAQLLLGATSPKEDVTSATKKLAAAANYTWKTTVTVPDSSRFRAGPTEGKTEKDGFTHLTLRVGEATTEAAMKGKKAAATNRDGDWQSVEDMENSEGPGRFLGRMVRNLKVPAMQAAELAGYAKDLKKDGDAY